MHNIEEEGLIEKDRASLLRFFSNRFSAEQFFAVYVYEPITKYPNRYAPYGDILIIK